MESDSDQESHTVVDTKVEASRRPPNTAFRQQRLKAWQPILTPRTVLPLFFTVAAVFALFGGLLIWASNQIQEVMLDYTWCGVDAPTGSFGSMPTDTVSYRFNQNTKMATEPQWMRADDGSTCTLRFDVPVTMKHPIYFFYRMTNFYQNHRRYVLSYNENQIEGQALAANDLGSAGDCKPLVSNAEGKPYYPCGLIANSMFNDSFSQELVGVNGTDSYYMTNKGISWPSDRERFKKTKYNASDVVPPPNWVESYPDGYTDDNLPDVSTWEEFQNWMRTAGLPTFAKMALRNDTADLNTGTYELSIALNFNTTVYDGKKYILLSTRTAIGGRNDFLGVAYCTVAGIAAALGIAFLTQHIIKPRRLGDHAYLSWNQPEAK